MKTEEINELQEKMKELQKRLEAINLPKVPLFIPKPEERVGHC